MIGPFGYFIYSIGLIKSYRSFNSASETTILNYTWPIFTILITKLFFRKRRSESKLFRVFEWAGVLFGFLSVFILATKGHINTFQISNISGIAWGMLSGISYGFFSSYSSTIDKDDIASFLLVSISVSLIISIVFSIKELALIKQITAQDILVVGILGCLLDGLGYIAWATANSIANEKKINISSVASLMFILPFLSLIVIFFFLRESTLFELYFIVSLLLIIISGILSQKTETITNYLLKLLGTRSK